MFGMTFWRGREVLPASPVQVRMRYKSIRRFSFGCLAVAGLMMCVAVHSFVTAKRSMLKSIPVSAHVTGSLR